VPHLKRFLTYLSVDLAESDFTLLCKKYATNDFNVNFLQLITDIMDTYHNEICNKARLPPILGVISIIHNFHFPFGSVLNVFYIRLTAHLTMISRITRWETGLDGIARFGVMELVNVQMRMSILQACASHPILPGSTKEVRLSSILNPKSRIIVRLN